MPRDIHSVSCACSTLLFSLAPTSPPPPVRHRPPSLAAAVYTNAAKPGDGGQRMGSVQGTYTDFFGWVIGRWSAWRRTETQVRRRHRLLLTPPDCVVPPRGPREHRQHNLTPERRPLGEQGTAAAPTHAAACHSAPDQPRPLSHSTRRQAVTAGQPGCGHTLPLACTPLSNSNDLPLARSLESPPVSLIFVCFPPRARQLATSVVAHLTSPGSTCGLQQRRRTTKGCKITSG